MKLFLSKHVKVHRSVFNSYLKVHTSSWIHTFMYFHFFLLRNTFCNAKFRGFFFITNRKLQFFCGSLKHGSVLSMLDNNTKTRTALTLPTDHTNSLAMGLLPTKETQGCRFLRSFFKNQTGHITKENSQKNGQFKGRFYTFIFSVVGFS